MVALYAGITVLERFPRVFNYPYEITMENARYQYQTARELFVVIKTELVAIFTYILWGMIETSKGTQHGLGFWFVIVVVVTLAATLAYYILRMSRHKGEEPL